MARSPLTEPMRRFRRIFNRIDLQAKISLVLVATIVPTFLIVTVAENKLTQPILAEEIRHLGISAGQTLASEIVSSRLLTLTDPTAAIESRMQELLYTQPNILRMEVLARDPLSGGVVRVGSNIVEDTAYVANPFPLADTVTSELREDRETQVPVWDIIVPVEQKRRDPTAPRRLVGNVRVVVSLGTVDTLVTAVWRVTGTAAAFSVVTLVLALGFFLRKAIANDRRLREAETKNLALTEQLHDAQRQLMNTEKLAVMGQLTAQFAHEIGTPLNAIGGHLQLLREEAPGGAPMNERLSIIEGQVSKIESIVKGFLQSTAKPTSQKQLVDVNQLIEKTLGIVRPRVESLGVRVSRDFDRQIGPVRAVPIELEQVFLNLLNNSLDSLAAKAETRPDSPLALELESSLSVDGGMQWVEASVYDTGEGIRRVDLPNVSKPFFTTKRPGHGTGLGLTICQQLAHKYGGRLEVDSKEGSWTRVTLKLPYA